MPTPLKVQYRPATRTDVPAIVRLLAEDDLGSRREHFTTPLPGAYYAAFEAIEADQNHELVAADANGEVVGTLHLIFLPSMSYQGGMRAQVESVHVAEHYRSQGIGAGMMEWAIESARQSGCHMMQLTSHKSRTDAHRFYENLGFAKSHIGMKIIL